MKLSIDGGELVFTDYDGKTICALLTEEGLILSTPRFDIEWQEFRDGVGTLLIPFSHIDERGGLPVISTPLADLGLDIRPYNCLMRSGIRTVEQLLERIEKGPDSLLVIRNFGHRHLGHVLAALRKTTHWNPDQSTWERWAFHAVFQLNPITE